MNLKEAIELAIQEELAAKAKYEDLARLAQDQETRLMLEQLAREEESHYKRLVDRLKAIKLLGR